MTEVDPEAEYREALAAFHAAMARLQRARGVLVALRGREKEAERKTEVARLALVNEAIFAGASHEKVRVLAGMKSRPSFSVIQARLYRLIFTREEMEGPEYDYWDSEDYDEHHARLARMALKKYREMEMVSA